MIEIPNDNQLPYFLIAFYLQQSPTFSDVNKVPTLQKMISNILLLGHPVIPMVCIFHNCKEKKPHLSVTASVLLIFAEQYRQQEDFAFSSLNRQSLFLGQVKYIALTTHNILVYFTHKSFQIANSYT